MQKATSEVRTPTKKKLSLGVAVKRSEKKEQENPLIGASTQDLDDHNAFLNRLTKLALPVAHKKVEEKGPTEENRFTSRHFFVVPSDYAEENQHKSGLESLPEEPFNIEVFQKTEEFKGDIGAPVKENIEIVSNFLLHEISPLLLGLDGGVEQARSIIHATVMDVDQYPFTTFELLIREAIKIKIANFVKEYFDLKDVDIEELVARILPPKQREVVVPIPMEGSRYETKPRSNQRPAEH